MTIKPLLDRVVVKAEKAEETTKSGIILTDMAIDLERCSDHAINLVDDVAATMV